MIRRLAALILTFTLLAACSATANQSDRSKEDIEKIIKSYLLENPEVLEMAFIALNEKREAEKAKQTKDAIAKNADALYNADAEFILGDPEAPVTVVEFFDYNCGYCKRSVGDMQKIVEDFDGKVRIIMKEYPILSAASKTAARAAIAAAEQGKYIDMHIALMAHRGGYDMGTIKAIAVNLGLDANQLEADIKNPDVQKLIDETRDLAQDVGATGTPAFFVGTKLIPGADIAGIRAAISVEILSKGL